jgi:hypothetical protein
LPRISDVEQLAYLGPIARRFGIDFRLHGGVASRVVARADGRTRPLDLFELTPFASDIDLLHTGAPGITGAIRDAILNEVPAAECFRWELRTEGEQRSIDRAMGLVGAVPARTISLVDSIGGQIIDPASGELDIEHGQFRFYFNPYYATSEAFRAGRAIPALSALLYLQTLFEAGLTGDQLFSQPGWGQAVGAVQTCVEDEVLRQIEEHAYLRARFWYLALNAFAAAPTRADFQLAAESLGLNYLLKLQSLPGSLLWPLNSLVDDSAGKTFTSSAHLRGDAYRLERSFSAAMDPAPPGIPLATNRQAALLTVPLNVMSRGIASSAAKASGGSEFFHLALPQAALNACAQIQDDARLSAIVQFGDFREPWVSVPLPCVVQRKHLADDRLFLRLNLFGLPEAMLNAGKSPVRVCLVGLLGEG